MIFHCLSVQGSITAILSKSADLKIKKSRPKIRDGIDAGYNPRYHPSSSTRLAVEALVSPNVRPRGKSHRLARITAGKAVGAYSSSHDLIPVFFRKEQSCLLRREGFRTEAREGYSPERVASASTVPDSLRATSPGTGLRHGHNIMLTFTTKQVSSAPGRVSRKVALTLAPLM